MAGPSVYPSITDWIVAGSSAAAAAFAMTASFIAWRTWSASKKVETERQARSIHVGWRPVPEFQGRHGRDSLIPVLRNNSDSPVFNVCVRSLFVKGDEWSAMDGFEEQRRVHREVRPGQEVDLVRGILADTWQEIGVTAVFEDAGGRCWERSQSYLQRARLDASIELMWTD